MSIPFLPAGIKLQTGRPQLQEPASVSRWGNRAISIFETDDKYWTVDVETQPLYDEDLAQVEAWLATARSGMETILFVPRGKQAYPRAYWSDRENAILDDTGTLTTVTNGKQLAIGSVTNGLIISAGDLISLATGDYRSLHRVTVGATASATAITLSVEPPVPSYIATGAVVRFKNPEMNARIVPGSKEVGDGDLPTAKFQLIEVPK